MGFTAYAAPAAATGATPGFTPYTPPAAPTERLSPITGKPYVNPMADAARGIGSAISTIKSAASSGVDQIKSGLSQAAHPGEAAGNMPLGLLKAGAGIVNTISSPIAPVLAPLAQPINAIADKVSNIPAVQNFALSKAGAYTDKAVEGAGNASTVLGAIVGAGTKPAADLASATSDGLTSALDTVSPFKTKPQLQSEAITNINKSLSNTGKASVSGLLNKDSSRLKGLETLYTMTKDQPITRPDGTQFNFDPTKITDPRDLLAAFSQSQKQIWAHVQSGLDKGSSITPDYSPIKATLQKTVDNSADPSLVAHAQSRLDSIAKLEKQGVQGAQTFLQESLNPRIGAAISGASDAPAVKMDVQVAHGINDALDNALSKVKGGSIGPMKDMYASLKSVEPDLVRMVQQTMRAKGGGIPQYINDFGNIALLEAAFAHNPALYLAKAGGMKILSKVLGTQRDPLDHLSKAFQAVQQYMGNAKAPTETPTLALPPGARGAPSQVSSGAPIQLPQLSISTQDAFERANPGIRQPSNNLPGPALLNAPGKNPIRLPAGNK